MQSALENLRRLSTEKNPDELKHAQESMETLLELDKLLKETGDMLGIKDQKNCSILMAVIICGGLAPGMNPDIAKVLLRKYNLQISTVDPDRKVLILCQKGLIELLQGELTPIGKMLLRHHFPELLFSLLDTERNGVSSSDVFKDLENAFKSYDLVQGLLKTISSQIPAEMKQIALKHLERKIIEGSVSTVIDVLVSQTEDLSLQHLDKISSILIKTPSYMPPKVK